MVWGAAAAALLVTAMASESFAIEGSDFTNYLRGATQGLPLGALPPPGIYGAFGLNATGLGPSPGKGNQTIPGAATAPSFGYGVSLLFVPGWTFLGATYGASVVQGMYLGTAESSVNPPFATSFGQLAARQHKYHADLSVVESEPWLVRRRRSDHRPPGRFAVAQHVRERRPQPRLLDDRAGRGHFLPRRQLARVRQLSL
jgi:hypothetical protein